MIKESGTMTINCKIELIHDLFSNPEWSWFDDVDLVVRQNAQVVVSLVRVLCTELGASNENLEIVCTEQAEKLAWEWLVSNGEMPWLFVADYGWQEDNRVVRYKKLWRARQEAHDFTGLILGHETAFCTTEGVRFAGIAQIESRGFSRALEIVRCAESAIILFSRRNLNAVDEVQKIFHSIFPSKRGSPQCDVDWAAASLAFGVQDEILVRTRPTFGDKEAFIDFFMRDERLASIPSINQPR